MKTNKRGETLVSILVGIIIVSIILTGIVIIHSSNYYAQAQFINKNKKIIIGNNLNKIVQKLDLSNIGIGEQFYLAKNENTQNYEVLTGSLNEHYKYINENLENIDINSKEINKYEVLYTIKNEDDFLGKKNKMVQISINDLNNN